VGDGHYDYRHNLADFEDGTTRNWLPAFESDALVCSDDWYVALDWNSTATRSMLAAIGRLPAHSVEEVENMVDKIVAYETSTISGLGWKNRVIMVGDDEINFERSGGNDGLSHIRQSETLAGYIPLSYNIDKIYLTEYELDFMAHKPAAHEDFIQAFNRGGGDGKLYWSWGPGHNRP